MSLVIVGAQWGDEGKGKVVDRYSEHARVIVRYQGGNNAGHTLIVGGKKTVLHLIPSGILHEGKLCLIANGVVFDPEVFFKELESLTSAGAISGAPEKRIQISERAHVILPYHRLMDRLREERATKGGGKIGTTVRGIGPAYEDKASRRGVQVGDLIRPDILRSKIEKAIEEKNVLLKHHYDAPLLEFQPLFDECLKMGQRLRPFIADVRKILYTASQKREEILFEGAQGTLLDMDHGTYPFVTSSNTISAGALTGSGLGLNVPLKVVGITKAYTTRVGAGPFPSEIETTEKETAEYIRKVGQEFGATTGRPRRVGWLDLVALKYAAEVNGMTGFALMKADCLSGLKTIRVCTAYKIDGKLTTDFPSSAEDLAKVEPQYEDHPGWEAYDAKKVREFKDLPQALQNYVRWIEKKTGVPVVLFSTGPGREETLELEKVFG